MALFDFFLLYLAGGILAGLIVCAISNWQVRRWDRRWRARAKGE